ncbi:MAG TPA: DUF4395 domain-containing protein [Sulfuricurvum sp.]|nr:DUF4395 domain-containing protein [Sulfuricurvum sp.]
MSKACPLLFRQIDATISKINSIVVLAIIALYFVTMHVAVLYFLIIDYTIRLSGWKHFSVINLFSSGVQTVFHLPVKMEDAGGKRLAAFFGLAFTVAIMVTYYLEWPAAGVIIALIFALCAVPDILFGYCIACKMYTLSRKFFPKWYN